MQVWAIISVILVIKSLQRNSSEFVAFLWAGMSPDRENRANFNFRQNGVQFIFSLICFEALGKSLTSKSLDFHIYSVALIEPFVIEVPITAGIGLELRHPRMWIWTT